MGDINSFISDEIKVIAGMLKEGPAPPQVPQALHPVWKGRWPDSKAKVKDVLVMKGIKIFGYWCDKPMMTMKLLREHSSLALVGLELYQAGLEEEVQVDTGSRPLDKVVGRL